MNADKKDTKQVPIQLWSHIQACDWDAAKQLLSEDFEAHWPQSQEKIIGRNNFIELNQRYPGSHSIEVKNVRYEYNQSNHTHKVATEVYIESKMPGGKDMKLFAIYFFNINSDDLITSATEYWADTYEAPAWRKDLVKTIGSDQCQ